MHLLRRLILIAELIPATGAVAQDAHPRRPFGTLREQALVQQHWLDTRMRTVLPPLMRKYAIDMWVVPIREYNEDPVFGSMTAPETFFARRRTIYVFFDKCAASGKTDPGDGSCVERLALGGSSQGGVFQAVRSTKTVDAAVGGRQAELWGDAQWQVLKDVISARNPKVIGINSSRVFAFSDGLSSGELEGMTEALGTTWSSRFRKAEGLPLDFIATRTAAEEVFYHRLSQLVWELISHMYSNEVITPGVTRTSDVVWWWRQQVNDLGLGTWFQPSIEVQRRGVDGDALGDDPIIERGDVLHCDLGITAMRLNTDTQHMAYVLRLGETDAPAGLKQALKNSNRLQDILFEETRVGRTGNEILAGTHAKLKAEGLNGTMYTHPIGRHGHGAGPLIGLWDYQEGVPGRGDARVISSIWFSSELQVTTTVSEWGGQPVRMAQEEDFILGADGKPRWAHNRQTDLWLIH